MGAYGLQCNRGLASFGQRTSLHVCHKALVVDECGNVVSLSQGWHHLQKWGDEGVVSALRWVLLTANNAWLLHPADLPCLPRSPSYNNVVQCFSQNPNTPLS